MSTPGIRPFLILADKLSAKLERRISEIAAWPDIRRLAVMPDVHEGASFPNGLVVATNNAIYPELIGGDIGCGVSAIAFDAAAPFLLANVGEEILRRLRSIVPTIKQPVSRARTFIDAPRADALSAESLARRMMRDGRLQLGTLGRGNHFIEFERDGTDTLWLVVHSGSRTMGQHILGHHRARAINGRSGDTFFLERGSARGDEYLQDVEWALHYARFNRLVIINRIADMMERQFGLHVVENSYIDSPHNFIRIESIGGAELIVHRKSANSAAFGEIGIIPGSMATGSRIVRGLGNVEALCSSSHGAGRSLSRRESFSRIRTGDFIQSMQGIVFARDEAASLKDEAPQAYRRLDDVMRAQRELVRTVAVLEPVLNDKRA